MSLAIFSRTFAPRRRRSNGTADVSAMSTGDTLALSSRLYRQLDSDRIGIKTLGWYYELVGELEAREAAGNEAPNRGAIL